MLDDPPATARIGLIAPPSNAVMEVEFYRSLPEDITVHTSHIYRSSAVVDADSMAQTADNAVETALTLAQAEPTIVVYGHAASSYAAGIGGDASLAEKIAEAAGAPAITTARASVRCLESVGARRIWFIAPYPQAIAQTGADFLAACGFEVVAVAGMGVERVHELKRLPLQSTYDLGVSTATRGDADALYICGTGIRTRGVVGALEQALGKPVISANLAALWSALDHLGCGKRFAFGESRLLEWQGSSSPVARDDP